MEIIGNFEVVWKSVHIIRIFHCHGKKTVLVLILKKIVVWAVNCTLVHLRSKTFLQCGPPVSKLFWQKLVLNICKVKIISF